MAVPSWLTAVAVRVQVPAEPTTEVTDHFLSASVVVRVDPVNVELQLLVIV